MGTLTALTFLLMWECIAFSVADSPVDKSLWPTVRLLVTLRGVVKRLFGISCS